jgi:hypothetical protein
VELAEDRRQHAVTLVGHPSAQFLDALEHAEAAAMKDGDAVGEAFGGLEDLGGEEDCAAAGGGVAGFGAEE